MSSELRHSYSNVCQQLMNQATALGTQISIAKENEAKRTKYTEIVKAIMKSENFYKRAIQVVQREMDDISEFLAEKKKAGNMAINAALLSARNVIPDSMEGVRLETEGKEAWLEIGDGMLVERMEGGGYRATLSLFMRKLALASAEGIEQLLIIDELLSKLSSESSAIISQYLPILAQNSQIIIIEQKPEVYSQLNCRRYHFFLTEGETSVREEDIHNGSEPVQGDG